MLHRTILCVQRSDAIRYAAQQLSDMGLQITNKSAPDVSHMLLPVPSSAVSDEYLAHVLADLPEDVIISGGNLNSLLLDTYPTVDFLKDPYYLAENAAITARCAIQIVEKQLGKQLTGCPVLVVGWGRIGKCLCHQLEKMGADVTCAARKDTDRAMIRALGLRSVSIDDAAAESMRYRVILNTVPVMVLPDLATQPDAIILELATRPGISGKNIIDARGLPSKMAPAVSGELIARTFLRLSLGKEV